MDTGTCDVFLWCRSPEVYVIQGTHCSRGCSQTASVFRHRSDINCFEKSTFVAEAGTGAMEFVVRAHRGMFRVLKRPEALVIR